MSLAHIDPLFNPLAAAKREERAVITASLLTAKSEKPPTSPYSNSPMQLAEGGYNNKTFKMWVDVANRQCIPVRLDV
jgi:hypothetical protein